MARKTTITKDMILEAALTMLIRDGYASVNIKTLAKEIGCSTQPIAWHFENMDGLRLALAQYAEEYARRKTAAMVKGEDAASMFEQMGRAYVRMALKEPNLFRFLYLGERPISKPFTMRSMVGGKHDRAMIEGIAEQTGLTKDQAGRCIQNTVIYAHGLATMVATGVLKASEKALMAMINDAAAGFVQKALKTVTLDQN